MGSTNLDLIIIIIILFVFIQSMMIQCINIQDLDDLILSYASHDITRRHTGSLYDISLPSNLSDIKSSVVTVRNSMFWRKGANFNGVYIPPMVKTVPYAMRIALVYQNISDHHQSSSSVYFRLGDDYSFVSPVIGFNVYDATNTSNLTKLNLLIKKDNPILIHFDSNYVSSHHEKSRIKCVAFGDNGLLNFSNTIKDYECGTMDSYGHFALVVLNQKTKPGLIRIKWWWFGLAAIGILVSVVVMIVIVKLVKKKKLKEMEKESEKSETIGNIWIGESRMPAATMVRTQPNLEYHEDIPSSSSTLT